MSEITRETSLYEVLIRVSPNGSWAAQYQTITELKEDGVAIPGIPPSVSAAMPLSEKAPEAFAIAEQIIGSQGAKNLEILKQLQETETAQIELIAELNGKVAEQAEAIEELKGRLEKLKSGSTNIPQLRELV